MFSLKRAYMSFKHAYMSIYEFYTNMSCKVLTDGFYLCTDSRTEGLEDRRIGEQCSVLE